ncbi:ribosome hibernation-promoting factor, HPF/YfiA family [Coxiella endosymbiont of Ornithodoros maritimus]|uniref:ribosome hibernation-promoting factor, HPF/YfiA family n=1 Tax=Coxiella endosymbiont of Ornithodoros maritimus TaxID=1656172 RepID=UPI002263AC6D|nr:ribosome-associated translation inhibitor RaiA [Coxiella endosymbiont of Ornithodoros maritimus]
MHIQMTGQGVDISPALRELTKKKLHRIQPCRDEISNIHIIFHINKLKKIVDANVKLPGSTINAQAESDDMYKTVDLLMHKLENQLSKYKAKKGDHR